MNTMIFILNKKLQKNSHNFTIELKLFDFIIIRR